jgi:hypothetical protein
MPIFVFTMRRSGCSRWTDLRVHDGPAHAFGVLELPSREFTVLTASDGARAGIARLYRT